VTDLLSQIPLPGEESGRSTRMRLFTINVVVTGRCNAACDYCHYYLARNRKDVAFDISDEQFDAYMHFVREWLAQVPGKTTYRFSGGDPMVLGDRLFQLSDRAYHLVGQKPFVITAGKSLDSDWADKARLSSISHVYVSVENPIRPANGAPDPLKVVRAIRELHTTELPIVPGVCVVPNDCFKHLHEICRWFVDELGTIPLISEVNYGAYKSPSEEEWLDLEANLKLIVRDFHDKVPLNLFSSVSPELAYGMHDPYIFELDLENSYGITEGNVQNSIYLAAEKLVQTNYPRLDCQETKCNWWEFCGNTKWYWQGDKNNSKPVKLTDYCRFKRIVNDVFFRELVDPSHLSTAAHIDILSDQ
jgi:MoaA/NifB/PqqE/SkfB family radical SAM enzyme